MQNNIFKQYMLVILFVVVGILGTVMAQAPATPMLTWPANAASGIAITPKLTWNTVMRATSYRVQVSTISAFTVTVVDDSALTVGADSLKTALANNTRYYWRVNAKNTTGTSAWSAVRNFTTVVPAPVTPVLTYPANAATEVQTAPTLTWGTVADAATYHVQLSTTSTFSSTLVDDSTLMAGTKAITGLSGTTVYYWRVNAKNTGGTSAWSTPFSFTTGIGAPVLTIPNNASTNVSITPTLTWSGVTGAVTYRVQLSTSSTFGTTIVDDSTLTATSKAVTGLSNSTAYYWRVNAKNASGTSAWSTVFNFYTTVLGSPSLSSPANAAIITSSQTPTLTWASVIGAATYRVQVSTALSFSSTLVDDSTLTTGTKTLATLNYGTYYWRVNAKNAGGAGAWSSSYSFTVATVGIVPAAVRYVSVAIGHSGVLEVYSLNGSRVLARAYNATAVKAQLLTEASKVLAKGCYMYRFNSMNASGTGMMGKLVK
jgi:hypothetical protein